jgi:hypothetical protein
MMVWATGTSAGFDFERIVLVSIAGCVRRDITT